MVSIVCQKQAKQNQKQISRRVGCHGQKDEQSTASHKIHPEHPGDVQPHIWFSGSSRYEQPLHYSSVPNGCVTGIRSEKEKRQAMGDASRLRNVICHSYDQQFV